MKSHLFLQVKYLPSLSAPFCSGIRCHARRLLAAGRNPGSGRETPHPFSHPGAEEEGDRGHGGRSGEQEIQTNAPESAGGQGEPAQVSSRTHSHSSQMRNTLNQVKPKITKPDVELLDH